MSALRRSGTAPAPAGAVGAIGAAWLVSLAFDVFLHAGLLAPLYARPSAVLLPADQAFARIPLGWAAFLILTGSLWWLLRRLDVRGARPGGLTGLGAGCILWGAWSLGLYSITRFEGDLLIGWWLGQSAELGVAGAVLGAAQAGMARRTLFIRVGFASALLVAVTVVLQALGLAPPMEIAAAAGVPW